ncbi:MAG: serine/threonine protein kinase, partial [Planctomycetota bacterium]
MILKSRPSRVTGPASRSSGGSNVAHQNSLLAPSTLLIVSDSSGVGEVRRFAQAAAEDLGFDETRAGKISIVATELANNLVRHAGGGMIVARVCQEGESGSIDLLSLDRGPGMRDVARCLEDGYSTLAGGAGTGLGAIRRLSDTFDIYSVPGRGSAVLSRFCNATQEKSRIEIGALSLPYPGETVCGDAWQVDETPMTCCIAVIDGLGHGIEAGAAARAAVRTVEAHCRRPIEQVLELAHQALKPTRGAAIALAEISLDSGHIAYAGVGNIVGATASADTLKRMVSFDGTIGHEVWKIKEFEYSLEPGQVLIMHSDGLKSHWKLDEYPGLLA